MELDRYKEADGRRLRFGWTTGSCAAAAARAAARALLTGEEPAAVRFSTPSGVELELPVECLNRGRDRASCGVRKDAGDDPDVTHGLLIRAEVRAEPGEGPLELLLAAGEGVGIVTLPGLDQPPGEPAINRVPREMILTALREEAERAAFAGRLTAAISVPGGKELAEKTFNPRLGILGGISILGTTGIVEPMSQRALIETIRVELRQRREGGAEYVLLTPGNYGSDFIRDGLGLDPALAVQTSNFIGDALDLCGELGFRGALLVGHVGKLVKLAGGMLNTHSRYGDCRMELLAAHAAAAGLPPGRVAELLDCAACDDALRILKEDGVCEETLARVTGRAAFHLGQRAGEGLEVGAVLFSKAYGLLSQTPQAGELLKHFRG